MFRTYVARTHQGLEEYAGKELANQGFSPFIPKARSVRFFKGKRIERTGVLFPGYLFVECDVKIQRWRCIASTRGIKQLLGWAEGMEEPLYVREKEMSKIRAMVNDGFVELEGHLPRVIKPQTMVRILTGPFEAFIAIVKKDIGHYVEADLSIFGRETKVTLPKECLVLA